MPRVVLVPELHSESDRLVMAELSFTLGIPLDAGAPDLHTYVNIISQPDAGAKNIHGSKSIGDDLEGGTSKRTWLLALVEEALMVDVDVNMDLVTTL